MDKKNCTECGELANKDEMQRIGIGVEAGYFCPKCQGTSFEEDVAGVLRLCMAVISSHAFDNEKKQCRECGTLDLEHHGPECGVAQALTAACDVILQAEC